MASHPIIWYNIYPYGSSMIQPYLLRKWDWGIIWRVKYLLRQCLDIIYIYNIYMCVCACVLGLLIGDFNRFFRISPGIPLISQPFLWPRHWGILCRPSWAWSHSDFRKTGWFHLLIFAASRSSCSQHRFLVLGDMGTLQKHPKYPMLVGCDRHRIIALDCRRNLGISTISSGASGAGR